MASRRPAAILLRARMLITLSALLSPFSCGICGVCQRVPDVARRSGGTGSGAAIVATPSRAVRQPGGAVSKQKGHHRRGRRSARVLMAAIFAFWDRSMEIRSRYQYVTGDEGGFGTGLWSLKPAFRGSRNFGGAEVFDIGESLGNGKPGGKAEIAPPASLGLYRRSVTVGLTAYWRSVTRADAE